MVEPETTTSSPSDKQPDEKDDGDELQNDVVHAGGLPVTNSEGEVVGIGVLDEDGNLVGYMTGDATGDATIVFFADDDEPPSQTSSGCSRGDTNCGSWEGGEGAVWVTTTQTPSQTSSWADSDWANSDNFVENVNDIRDIYEPNNEEDDGDAGEVRDSGGGVNGRVDWLCCNREGRACHYGCEPFRKCIENAVLCKD